MKIELNHNNCREYTTEQLKAKLDELDYSKIDNIELEGIETKDYPNFSNAFVTSADYDGVEMTDEQLYILNEDRDFVYDCVQEYLY